MRKATFLALLAFFALASPAALHAQFQEPTKEELQMTSDPKAPGAAAVYLFRQETTDDALHFKSYYERVKVLTEKGKELATVRIPYEVRSFKVAAIRGRTIHSDGTVIPLAAKPSDLVDVKTAGYQRNTTVFTLPSVEVGSILEYYLQLRYDDNLVSEPIWEIQQPYFVHKAHYFFNPSKSDGIMNSRGDVLDKLMYGVHAGNDAKMVHDPVNHYTFDIADVPPIPNDDWMPPLNSVNWRVDFYYTNYSTGAEFWQNEGKRWAKEANRFANPSKTLQQAAAEIVAPGDSDDVKAHKIYDALQKLDNTSFTRQKSAAERKNEKLKAINDAEGVWKEKSGYDDEIALLYVALARAAGLQAYPMQVVNRSRATFDPTYLSTSQLDDYIAIVVIGGKEVFLDPGQKMCPFGLLHWKHTLAGGLRLASSGNGYAVTPSNTFLQNAVQRIADLSVDTDGSVKGTVRFVMTGQEALRWRQLSIKDDTDEVKKQFNESMRAYLPDGVQADFDHFLALDDYNNNLMGFVQVSGNLGASTGKRFFLPGLFFESHSKHPFVAEDKRTIPIDVLYPKKDDDDVTYHLPPGYSIESTPQVNTLTWPKHAMLKIFSSHMTDAIQISRNMVYNYTLLDPKDYADLHDFYQKVATADQQQLVLTRTQVAQGN